MKGVNTKILCLIVCCWVSSCITISEQNDRSYSELPTHINQRYGSDIIDNQEMALKFVRLVFENKLNMSISTVYVHLKLNLFQRIEYGK